jgi:hypothetical protein
MQRYEHPDDVSMRLQKTFVRYHGRPVMVHHISGFMLEAIDAIDDTRTEVDANDEELDISSPPIGYVNTGKLLYLSRAPYRRQRQGLYLPDCLAHAEPQTLGEGWRRPNRDIDIGIRPVGECILGKYPNAKTVVKNIEKGNWTGGAFHRKMGFVGIANTKALELRYVCENFGMYLPKENVVLVTAENFERNKTALNILLKEEIPVEIVKTPEG